MKKKKETPTPRKVQIVLEVEENHTGCCECLFEDTCPYSCAFAGKLDCARYDLSSVVLKSINPIDE